MAPISPIYPLRLKVDVGGGRIIVSAVVWQYRFLPLTTRYITLEERWNLCQPWPCLLRKTAAPHPRAARKSRKQEGVPEAVQAA
jgi:hypothetical protein